MVVDDIVVVGARPLFMTDYIACGKVVPERIATIVEGIARACSDTGTALVGGETAEHPGVMAARRLRRGGRRRRGGRGGCRARPRARAARRRGGRDRVERTAQQRLLAGAQHPRPARRRLRPIASTSSAARSASRCSSRPGSTRRSSSGCSTTCPDAVHALSHVTGGGIAANLARVLPHGSWVELDRSHVEPAAGVPGARGVGRPVASPRPRAPGISASG